MHKCILFLLIFGFFFMCCEPPITDGVSEVAEREGIKHHKELEKEMKEFYPALDNKEEQLHWVKQQLKTIKLDKVINNKNHEITDIGSIDIAGKNIEGIVTANYLDKKLKQITVTYDNKQIENLYIYADKLLAVDVHNSLWSNDSRDNYYYFNGKFIGAEVRDSSSMEDAIVWQEWIDNYYPKLKALKK